MNWFCEILDVRNFATSSPDTLPKSSSFFLAVRSLLYLAMTVTFVFLTPVSIFETMFVNYFWAWGLTFFLTPHFFLVSSSTIIPIGRLLRLLVRGE